MKQRLPRGFTLLELIVGLTVFSLVIVVLYAGYRLAIRSWESGEGSHAAVSELRLAGAFVRRHTAQAFPLTFSANNAWHLWFEGEAHRMVLVTSMPTFLGQGGMYEMAFTIDRHDDGAALMVSRRLLHPDVESGQPGVDDMPRVLVDDLESARFEFFGAPIDGGAASWHTRWMGRKRLPRLVRLRLSSNRVGEWPEIVVRLPIDAIRYQRTVAAGGPGGVPGFADSPTPGEASILAPRFAK